MTPLQPAPPANAAAGAAVAPTSSSPIEASDDGGGYFRPRLGAFGNLRRVWRRHAYILPSIAIATLVFSWLITWGDWKFFQPEEFSTYFDAHAQGILHGHLDASPRELAAEDFIFEGKHYGYFGSAPSLIRIPLQLMFGAYVYPEDARLGNFSWARPFMTAAFALGLAYVYGFLVRARRLTWPEERNDTPIPTPHKLVYSLLIVTAGLGTSALFMGSRAFVFHEAIMLAALFMLACAYNVLAYLEEPHRWGRAVTAGIWAGLAMLTRATGGAAAELAMCLTAVAMAAAAFGSGGGANPSRWLDILRGIARQIASMAGVASYDAKDEAAIARVKAAGREPRWWYAILPAVMAALGIAVYLSFNYMKFRTFEGVPLRYYVRYLENTDPNKDPGRMVYTRNIKTTAKAYFTPNRILMRPHFPYLFMARVEIPPKRSKVLAVEPFSSITGSSPAISAFALVGLVGVIFAMRPAARRWRIPVAAAVAGGGVVLTTVAISQRYAHDLWPALVLCMALGVNPVLRVLPRIAFIRRGLAVVLVIACAYSIWAYAAFSMEYQREHIWGVPENKKLEYTAFRRAVDGMLGGTESAEPLPVVKTDNGIRPEHVLPGQLWRDTTRGTTMWFNGRDWLNPVMRDPGIDALSGGGDVVHFKVAFHGGAKPGDREPLVTSGRINSADFLFFEHGSDPNRGAVVFDHWGAGGPRSGLVDFVPGHLYDFSARLDHVNSMLTVWFDGRPLMEQATPVCEVVPGGVALGENRLNDGIARRFGGTVFPLFERPRPRERDWTATATTAVPPPPPEMTQRREQLAAAPAPAAPSTVSSTPSEPLRDLPDGQRAVDSDMNSEWLVSTDEARKGPVTLSLRANSPVRAGTLYLVGRAGAGGPGWRRVTVRYYVGVQIGVQTFGLHETAPGEVQALKLDAVTTDRFDLTFSDPISETPGYAEVILGWN